MRKTIKQFDMYTALQLQTRILKCECKRTSIFKKITVIENYENKSLIKREKTLILLPMHFLGGRLSRETNKVIHPKYSKH